MMGAASAYDIGMVTSFGRSAAIAGDVRCESGRLGSDAIPSVVGSPAYLKV